jgi:hypothetical protein
MLAIGRRGLESALATIVANASEAAAAVGAALGAINQT